MTTISIFIIAHIVAGCYNYWFTKVAYSKNGRWEGQQTYLIDFALLFVPILSVLYAGVCICNGGPYSDEYKESKNKINFDKFFNIKRD